MKKLFVLLFILLTIDNINAQSFLVKKNIISTSLFTPFEIPGGYGLSVERMLDKGRSPNVAQFSLKLNTKIINDKQAFQYTTFNGIELYDKNAFQYNGISFIPEIKYYFGWNSPFGPYFSLYGSYVKYSEIFNDIIDDQNNYILKSNQIGRGLGCGYQFALGEFFAMDVSGGYIIEDVNLKKQDLGEEEFLSLEKLKEDGLRVSITLGISF